MIEMPRMACYNRRERGESIKFGRSDVKIARGVRHSKTGVAELFLKGEGNVKDNFNALSYFNDTVRCWLVDSTEDRLIIHTYYKISFLSLDRYL